MITTSAGSTVRPCLLAYEPAIADTQFGDSERDGVPQDGAVQRVPSRPTRTAFGAPALGCPADRLTRSPWLRWRSAAASHTSIT